jgi:hypothetical protein
MLRMWVIAADSTACRFFAAGASAGPLQEIEVLSHPEGRLREQDAAAICTRLPGQLFPT